MDYLTTTIKISRKVGETALLRATLSGDTVDTHTWTPSATGFTRGVPVVSFDKVYTQCGYKFTVAGTYTITCAVLTTAGQEAKPQWVVVVK